jgi:hypothetical protein
LHERAQLLIGVLAERAARKGAPPDDASGAARMDNYCRWNACVVDELKLGNGGFDTVADEYELHVQFGLPVPELFEREAEPTERDIKLKPFIKRCEQHCQLLCVSATQSCRR